MDHKKTISAYGICSPQHAAFWVGYKVKEMKGILHQLERQGDIVKLKVDGLKGDQWMPSKDADTLNVSSLENNTVAFLTSMDNLIRDRKWLEEIFRYTFQIEYFQTKGYKWRISTLHGTDFLGFMDAKIHRPARQFIIKEIAPRKAVKREKWETA